MCIYSDPNYIVYDNEVEEKCDICGGCDNIGSCSQGQELQACNRATLEHRQMMDRLERDEEEYWSSVLGCKNCPSGPKYLECDYSEHC